LHLRQNGITSLHHLEARDAFAPDGGGKIRLHARGGLHDSQRRKVAMRRSRGRQTSFAPT